MARGTRSPQQRRRQRHEVGAPVRAAATVLAIGLLLFGGYVALGRSGAVGGLVGGARPTADPRFAALVTEQALSWERGPSPPARRAGGLGPTSSRPAATGVAAGVTPPHATATGLATATGRATATGSRLIAVAQIARAEAALSSGEFTVTVDYGGGVRSIATARFDLGDNARMPRLSLATTYVGATGQRRTERIIIGARAWERAADGPWREVANGVGVREQIGALLPRVAAASPSVAENGREAILRWSDPEGSAVSELLAEPATGIPRLLTRTYPARGLVETVRYTWWNVPVTVDPPSAHRSPEPAAGAPAAAARPRERDEG